MNILRYVKNRISSPLSVFDLRKTFDECALLNKFYNILNFFCVRTRFPFFLLGANYPLESSWLWSSYFQKVKYDRMLYKMLRLPKGSILMDYFIRLRKGKQNFPGLLDQFFSLSVKMFSKIRIVMHFTYVQLKYIYSISLATFGKQKKNISAGNVCVIYTHGS